MLACSTCCLPRQHIALRQMPHNQAQQTDSCDLSMPTLISATDFSASYTAGKHWIAIDGSVYDVSSWCNAHPGGQLVLLHSAARDASEAFHAYHPDWVRKRLPAFKIGQLERATPPPCKSAAAQPLPGISEHPLIAITQVVHRIQDDGEGAQQLTAANGERLKQVQYALEAQGLFGTSLSFYCKLGLCCLACLGLAIWCVLNQHITIGALLLGLFWQQVCSTKESTMLSMLSHSQACCMLVIKCLSSHSQGSGVVHPAHCSSCLQ